MTGRARATDATGSAALSHGNSSTPGRDGRAANLHLLILGGSAHSPGGVEAFCDRAFAATTTLTTWRVARIFTNTAYLRAGRFPAFGAGLRELYGYRAQRPDCVWLQYHNLPDLAYLMLAKGLGMRVVVTPHLGRNWRSQSNPVLRWISGHALRLADRFALLSRTQEGEVNLPSSVPRTLIRTFLPAEVVGPAARPAGPRASALQIVHSGRLSVGKGSFLAVEVCARLRAAGVPFSARIIGAADRETYDALDALIARHGLGDAVQVIEWLPVHELLDHLARADVLLHLSLIDSYPLIVLEAMACGAVPVCLDLDGAADMVATYGGHIVDVAHGTEDATAWLAAQDLATLRAERQRAAAAVRADYGWTSCVAALDTALRATIAGRGAENS